MRLKHCIMSQVQLNHLIKKETKIFEEERIRDLWFIIRKYCGEEIRPIRIRDSWISKFVLIHVRRVHANNELLRIANSSYLA